MAITKSAKKAIRQNKKKKARNASYRKSFKKAVKEVRDFVSKKKIKEAKELLPKAFKILDKSAKANVIKKNTASRLKSRLAIMINKAEKA